MLIEGTLNRYLADINQQAEQMFHRLIEEMAQKQGVTEQLKAKQPMEWIFIGLMIRGRRCCYTSSPLFFYSQFLFRLA